VSWEGNDHKIYASGLPYQGVRELAFMKLREKKSTVMNGLSSSGRYFIVTNTRKLQTVGPVGLKSRAGLCKNMSQIFYVPFCILVKQEKCVIWHVAFLHCCVKSVVNGGGHKKLHQICY